MSGSAGTPSTLADRVQPVGRLILFFSRKPYQDRLYTSARISSVGASSHSDLLKDVEYIVRFFVDRGKFFNVVSERQWKRYLVENASGLRIFKPNAIL